MLEAAGSAHNSLDPTMSGCTASVVLHQYQEQKLYVAHVGDSRCVLGRRSGNGTFRSVTLELFSTNVVIVALCICSGYCC